MKNLEAANSKSVNRPIVASHHPRSNFLGAHIALSLAVWLAASPAIAGKKKSDREATMAPTISMSQPTITGPKRTVAVGKFVSKEGLTTLAADRKGRPVNKQWSVDIVGSMTSMVTTALIQTGQFSVVERHDLDAILDEQELLTSGVTSAKSGVGLGGVLGAQLIIMGEVTELSEGTGNGGTGLGGAVSKRFGIKLGSRTQVGSVGVEVRIIDTTTGEAVAAYFVSRQTKSKSVQLSAATAAGVFNHDSFKQTALGQAVRDAVEEIVYRFAQEVARRPWKGNVVLFDQGEVAINAGSEDGVNAGDRFEIYSRSQKLTDPETGRVLGYRKRLVGTVVVTDVQEGVAFGTFGPVGEASPERGDLVQYVVR